MVRSDEKNPTLAVLQHRGPEPAFLVPIGCADIALAGEVITEISCQHEVVAVVEVIEQGFVTLFVTIGEDAFGDIDQCSFQPGAFFDDVHRLITLGPALL